MDFHRLDEFIVQFMRETGTPGVAVALTDRDRTRHFAVHGWADIASGTPVTPDTLFEIGSVTKSFTAVALMQQWEAGRFDPHAPVVRYLPWFEVQSSFAPITGHHCLTHTAGLPNGRYDVPEAARYQVRSLRHAEVGAPPGEHWYYSNLGYEVLTYVLEAVSGRRFADVVADGILKPLGMESSEAITTNDIRQRLATGYEYCFDDRPPHRSDPLVQAPWVELRSGGGGVSATPRDMAAYVRMLLNRGKPILSDAAFERLMQRAARNELGHYAYGLNVIEKDGKLFLAHNGGSIGHGCWMMADLTTGLGLVVMINGPARGFVVRNFAYRVLLALHTGNPLPEVAAPADPLQVDRPEAYAGDYTAGDLRVRFRAEGADRLSMETDGAEVLLEPREPDVFYVNHPAFDRFLLRFGRDSSGMVVEAFHGPTWLVSERYTGPTDFAVPQEWSAFPGRYRCTHPWWRTFSVVLRKGTLWMVHPFAGEQPLVPLPTGAFRVGSADWLPERIRFDEVVGGRALRLDYSGCAYYRM